MSDHLNCVDSEFVVAWWSPLRAIDNIRSDLSEQCELGFLHRFLHHVKFSAQLDEYVENLDQAWRAFDTYCLIALQHRMNQQARLSAMQSMYDEKQNRLFRLLEFNLREDCGTWSIGPLATGPEWSCDWQGRTIIVRVLKAGAASKSGSVSSSSKRQVTTRDPKERLRTWLQMILDYKAASAAFDEMYPQLWHHHWCQEEACFPNTSRKGNGRLIFALEDLLGRHQHCMMRFWYSMFYQEPEPGHIYSLDTSYTARPCLAGRGDVGEYTGIANGSWLQNVALGDYRYGIHDTSSRLHFVRLGNVRDLLVHDPRLRDSIAEVVTSTNTRPCVEHSCEKLSWMLYPCSRHCSTYKRLPQIKPWCQAVWFEQVVDIAAQHQLPINALVLVQQLTQSVRIQTFGNEDCRRETKKVAVQHQQTVSWARGTSHTPLPCNAHVDSVPFGLSINIALNEEDIVHDCQPDWGHWTLSTTVDSTGSIRPPVPLLPVRAGFTEIQYGGKRFAELYQSCTPTKLMSINPIMGDVLAYLHQVKQNQRCTITDLPS